jgi:hypothetical protein
MHVVNLYLKSFIISNFLISMIRVVRLQMNSIKRHTTLKQNIFTLILYLHTRR